MESWNTSVGNCEILAGKSKRIPLHIPHHCTIQTSAALAAYYKLNKTTVWASKTHLESTRDIA